MPDLVIPDIDEPVDPTEAEEVTNDVREQAEEVTNDVREQAEDQINMVKCGADNEHYNQLYDQSYTE